MGTDSADPLDEPGTWCYSRLNIRPEFGGACARAARRPWSSRPLRVAAGRPLGPADRWRVRADLGNIRPGAGSPRRIVPSCQGARWARASRTAKATMPVFVAGRRDPRTGPLSSLAYVAVAAVAVPVSLRGPRPARCRSSGSVPSTDGTHLPKAGTRTQPGPETRRGSKRNGITSRPATGLAPVGQPRRGRRGRAALAVVASWPP